MEPKHCSKCATDKTVDDFHKNSKRADGLAAYCKSCVRVASSKHYEANKDRILEQHRAWKADNPERNDAINRAWYENNRERAYSNSLAWRRANPVLVAGYDRAHRERYPDKHRAIDSARSARRRGNYVEPVTLQALRKRDGDVCCICNGWIDFALSHPDPASPSLEHIIPLSRGGEHSMTNAGIAHLRCNLLKNQKLMSEITEDIRSRFVGNLSRLDVK